MHRRDWEAFLLVCSRSCLLSSQSRKCLASSSTAGTDSSSDRNSRIQSSETQVLNGLLAVSQHLGKFLLLRLQLVLGGQQLFLLRDLLAQLGLELADDRLLVSKRGLS